MNVLYGRRSPSGHKRTGHVELEPVCGELQWGGALAILSVDVGPNLDQVLDDADWALQRGVVQLGSPISVSGEVGRH